MYESDDQGLERSPFADREDAIGARLERIAGMERQVCALQAAQVHETADYVRDRLQLDDDMGVPSSPARQRCMAAEVALARGVSVGSAEIFMADAYELSTAHPATMGMLAAGRLGLFAAKSIVHETQLLNDACLKALADEVIAEEAVDVLPGKVRALAERRVIEIDPDAAARRAVVEREDKQVHYLPTGESMATLNAYLPAEQAAACWHALDDHARALRAAGDPRSIRHLMCDTLVERVTGLTRADTVKAHVNLVMSDTTMLGIDDKPAHLIGYGPIPAQVARLIASSGSAWLKRLYTDPVTGEVTAADSRRRRFDGALRDLITIRDQQCRGIRCASPIRDIDHPVEYASGGHTTPANAQGLSKNCHTTREHPRMRVVPDADTSLITWRTPSGLTYRSLPPPALGPGSLKPAQVRLRHRLLHPPPSQQERQLLRYLTHRRHAG
ncbi:MAG: DUF222 domain-containing protein [Nocardioidaceae bacterium]|nr:DUF222 domain-containing protein [Nocardioidaceae bacterium]